MRYRNHADARIRARFEREARVMKTLYSSALWAMERHLRRTNAAVSERIHMLRRDFYRALGPWSAISSRLLGPALLWTTRREEKRLARGQTYEPPTFIERTNGSLP